MDKPITTQQMESALQDAWEAFAQDPDPFPDCFILGPDTLSANFNIGPFAAWVTDNLNRHLFSNYDDMCPECECLVEGDQGDRPGKVIRPPGWSLHHAWCPTIPKLPDTQVSLRTGGERYLDSRLEDPEYRKLYRHYRDRMEVVT